MEELGIYYFHQGTNYYAYELMGAHYSKEKTIFRTWAPNAKDVSVVGDFNNWDTTKNKMTRITDGGIWEIEIPNLAEYTNYKYAIKVEGKDLIFKADPFAFYSDLGESRASKIFNLDNYIFTDDKWMKNRKDKQALYQPLNIYEVHLGSWRKYQDGSFFNYRKLGKELAVYCKKMGYTHVEIMPLHEHPFDSSWGYQVTGYYSITSRYGTPIDFMDMVNTLHNRGIGVILDWVPAHFSKDSYGLIDFDGSHLYEPSDPLRMEHKACGMRCFDYGKSEVQSFLVSNAMFLVDKFHIDGLRVDEVESMLYLDYDRNNAYSKNIFGGNLNLEAVAFLQKTNNALHEHFPGVITIAEVASDFPNVTKMSIENGLGFDYKWNMGWMNDSLLYVKTDPLYKGSIHNKITFPMTYIYNEKFILPLSHNEVVQLKGSLLNKMPGNKEDKFCCLKTYLMYMMSHPGKKLLFMGSEFGTELEWSESRQLDWGILKNPENKNLQKFVSVLNKTYLKHKAFYRDEESWNGFKWIKADDSSSNVFIYKRMALDDKDLIVILNFAYMIWPNYKISLDNGLYEVCLYSNDVEFGGDLELNHKRFEVTNKELCLDIPRACGIYLRRIKKI